MKIIDNNIIIPRMMKRFFLRFKKDHSDFIVYLTFQKNSVDLCDNYKAKTALVFNK